MIHVALIVIGLHAGISTGPPSYGQISSKTRQHGPISIGGEVMHMYSWKDKSLCILQMQQDLVTR